METISGKAKGLIIVGAFVASIIGVFATILIQDLWWLHQQHVGTVSVLQQRLQSCVETVSQLQKTK